MPAVLPLTSASLPVSWRSMPTCDESKLVDGTGATGRGGRGFRAIGLREPFARRVLAAATLRKTRRLSLVGSDDRLHALLRDLFLQTEHFRRIRRSALGELRQPVAAAVVGVDFDLHRQADLQRMRGELLRIE